MGQQCDDGLMGARSVGSNVLDLMGARSVGSNVLDLMGARSVGVGSTMLSITPHLSSKRETRF